MAAKIVSAASIAMLSILVSKKGGKWEDEAGNQYRSAPKRITVGDVVFKLQEEEEATPGLPDFWWHYHRAG